MFSGTMTFGIVMMSIFSGVRVLWIQLKKLVEGREIVFSKGPR